MIAKILAAAALAAGLLAGGAQAATVVQTRDFTNITVTSLEFDAFDTGLGTLTGVTLAISSNVKLAPGTIVGRTEDGLFSASIEGVFRTGVGSEVTVRAFDFGVRTSCAGGATCEADYAGIDQAVSLSGSGDELARIAERGEALDIEIGTTLSIVFGSFGSDPTTRFTASGTATLTYFYDPVTEPDLGVIPLPGSLQLALGGLALLGGLGYRRRSRA